MNDGAVDDYAGREHHAAADDGSHIFDLLQRDFEVFSLATASTRATVLQLLAQPMPTTLMSFRAIRFAGSRDKRRCYRTQLKT